MKAGRRFLVLLLIGSCLTGPIAGIRADSRIAQEDYAVVLAVKTEHAPEIGKKTNERLWVCPLEEIDAQTPLFVDSDFYLPRSASLTKLTELQPIVCSVYHESFGGSSAEDQFKLLYVSLPHTSKNNCMFVLPGEKVCVAAFLVPIDEIVRLQTSAPTHHMVQMVPFEANVVSLPEPIIELSLERELELPSDLEQIPQVITRSESLENMDADVDEELSALSDLLIATPAPKKLSRVQAFFMTIGGKLITWKYTAPIAFKAIVVLEKLGKLKNRMIQRLRHAAK